MNNEIPKWLQRTILGVVAVIAVLVFLSYDRLHVYGRYLREKSPDITVNFSGLSVDMDEAKVRKHFEGLALTCIGQGPGNDSLGDRVCYASIDKADGDAALTLAAFFRKGKLVHAMVQMPWWVLNSWHRRFTAQYGYPVRAGNVSLLGGPVLRWSMPNGHIESNRNRSFNPLSWNVIFWTGKNP